MVSERGAERVDRRFNEGRRPKTTERHPHGRRSRPRVRRSPASTKPSSEDDERTQLTFSVASAVPGYFPQREPSSRRQTERSFAWIRPRATSTKSFNEAVVRRRRRAPQTSWGEPLFPFFSRTLQRSRRPRASGERPSRSRRVCVVSACFSEAVVQRRRRGARRLDGGACIRSKLQLSRRPKTTEKAEWPPRKGPRAGVLPAKPSSEATESRRCSCTAPVRIQPLASNEAVVRRRRRGPSAFGTWMPSRCTCFQRSRRPKTTDRRSNVGVTWWSVGRCFNRRAVVRRRRKCKEVMASTAPKGDAEKLPTKPSSEDDGECTGCDWTAIPVLAVMLQRSRRPRPEEMVVTERHRPREPSNGTRFNEAVVRRRRR